MRMRQASITVFLALIFLLMLSFVCSLLESVRVRTARAYYQMAMASAAESVTAGYCRELFEEYGLLFYWPNQRLLTEEAEEYLSYYADPGKGLPVRESNLYRLTSEQLQVQNVVRAGDNGAMALRSQILAAVGYEKTQELLGTLQEQTNLTIRGNELYEQLEQAKKQYEETDWYELPVSEETAAPEEGRTDEMTEEEWQQQMSESVDGSLFDQLQEWIRRPFLTMVLPDGSTVSSAELDADVLNPGFAEEEGTYRSVLDSSLLEQVLIDEYVLMNTSCFTAPSSGTGLCYETEYVLCGEDSDEANLNETVKQLLLMREGLNLIWLLQDAESMQQAELLADALVGWTMLPLLVGSVRMVLLSAWAYAESVVDVRRLLSGTEIPLLKDKSTWEVTMERIPLLLSGQTWESNPEQSGLSYQAYLRILLLKQKEKVTVERMAGLIQYHMHSLNPRFCLRDCVSEAEYVLTATLSNGFLLSPAWNEYGQKIHEISIRQNFSYETR